MRTIDELRMLQALPLELKVAKTKLRIREWVNQFGVEGVYVAFSGGKDSTVLLHIVRQLYPEVEAVFVNTGLEYPEIQRFVKTFDNVTILRPKMRFDEVIKTYGYPVISKDVAQSIHDVRTQADIRGISVTKTKMYDRYFNPESDYAKKYPSFSRAKWDALFDMPFKMSHKCCDVMKKAPTKQHEKLTGKKPMLATMASESRLRQTKWLAFGCNAFEQNRPTSQPMSFWTEQDVLQYIKQNNIQVASVYGDIVYAENPEQLRLFDQCESLKTSGCDRTGCVFCGFGCHLDKLPTRFQRLKETHPRQYEYCIGGGEFNEDGIWQPNKQGLGMGYVFDQLNKIYGDDFIKYK